MLDDIVILSAIRTPLGGFQGALASLAAPALGAHAIKAAVDQPGVKSETVDEVYFGNVVSAGIGQAPARQAALSAGLSIATPCTTVSKVCGSGMKAVMQAADSIRLGDVSVVVAGGMESMSNAPYLLSKARVGHRLGHQETQDSLFVDGLEDKKPAVLWALSVNKRPTVLTSPEKPWMRLLLSRLLVRRKQRKTVILKMK